LFLTIVSVVMLASSFFSLCFFSLFNFCRRKHSFQVCPSDFPELCFLNQVQVLDFGKEESEFNIGILPFLLSTEGLEINRVVSSSGSEVTISISRGIKSAYDKLPFVVRLSATFLWCLTKNRNNNSLLALSLSRKAAQVFQYKSGDPFESFVTWCHWDSNFDIKSDRLLPEYWVGRETRFIN